ncbi:sn-glycerol-3-phosphate-binding periplasmic protein UgpB [Clostridium aceticum]|uniref:sn-glycerol-3-phosphate-binding periplasmic protein UgpB n=1 Tax=Clostridium aceticum TaxID=84022 RepID=A0A0D8IBS9_9CLOT|nr:ABC transporter substrate-binding protein [Clostridium aceticum]AKL96421.1 sn-glycerol-3-phosphate-binding periplasmic protein UgpB [Clostridium aceticum]KJF27402.1 sugar ABC transporter substrate-binding protein [Clostridium aceticum]
MFKKKSKMVLLAALMMFNLIGCGTAATGVSPDESAVQKVEIDFWYSLGGEAGELIEAMTQEFNKSQDKIYVNPTYQGDYYTNHAKVMAGIASNTQPDVTMVEIASIAAFADAGALEGLSSYVAKEEAGFIDDYVKGLMGNSYWKNELYAISFNRSTPLLYVNADMLEANGLDPAGPKTWEELVTYSRKLSGNGRYGFSTPIDIWFYEALTFQSGGNILSEDGTKAIFNSKEGVAPVEFWESMLAEGIMKMPPGERYNAWDVARQDFINENVGMIFTTTGHLKGLLEQCEFEVATAFLPANKDFGVPTGGANLVILAQSSDEKKKAAWEFIKYMTSTENSVFLSKLTGYMPVRTSAIEDPGMEEFYSQYPQFTVAIEQLQYAKPRPMAPGYRELQEIIMRELQRAILDSNVSPQEALDAAAAEAQRLLR